MDKTFKFIMISAMYENGGNTTQRHLDGHPNLFVYPFESQVGNRRVSDYLASLVPHKYRWPQFALGQEIEEMYEDIFDEEVKIRVKTPHMSKFKDAEIKLIDKERKEIFVKLLKKEEITRGNIVKAFYVATFKAWKNFNASGKEKVYVGYNPVQVLDADKIIADFPKAKILHVVRNPFSAYAETMHRPAPLSLERYINTWNIVQLAAINFSKIYPENVVIMRFEDMIDNQKKFFTGLCKKLEISFDNSLLYPSWNGSKLENIYPWGTVQYPTVAYNLQKRDELTKKEYEKIKLLTAHFNEYFDYKDF